MQPHASRCRVPRPYTYRSSHAPTCPPPPPPCPGSECQAASPPRTQSPCSPCPLPPHHPRVPAPSTHLHFVTTTRPRPTPTIAILSSTTLPPCPPSSCVARSSVRFFPRPPLSILSSVSDAIFFVSPDTFCFHTLSVSSCYAFPRRRRLPFAHLHSHPPLPSELYDPPLPLDSQPFHPSLHHLAR